MSNKDTTAYLSSLSKEELVAIASKATEFIVTALPEDVRDDPDNRHWVLRVVWRSEDRWAVGDGTRQLNTKGEWDYESQPSNRTDDYIANYRHDLPTAIALAEEAAKHIVINGLDIDSVAKWTRARRISAENSELDFNDILASLEPNERLQKIIALRRENSKAKSLDV